MRKRITEPSMKREIKSKNGIFKELKPFERDIETDK